MSGLKQLKPFEIYRAAEALDYAEHNIQLNEDPPPAAIEAMGSFVVEGGMAGQQVKLAYARPGFSLTKVWFKSGYPLPLHSHTGGCLYHIVAGSIRIGADVLGPGDGFFVDHDVPYTYETGPEGVEVLEFRATEFLDIRFKARSKAAWNKIVGKLKERGEAWMSEPPPSQASPKGRSRA
jgi:hypothetical protein